MLAHLAAEQAPDGHAKVLAEDIPQRHLDARDRRHPDDAHAPEAMTRHHLRTMLDVARIEPDEHRLDVLDGADHCARFELERRLTPTDEARLVGLDSNEDPVAELRVADACGDGGDLHGAAVLR